MNDKSSLDSRPTPKEIRESEQRKKNIRIGFLFITTHFLHFFSWHLFSPPPSSPPSLEMEYGHTQIEVRAINFAAYPPNGEKRKVGLYSEANQLLIAKAYLWPKTEEDETSDERAEKVLLEIPQDDLKRIVQQPRSYYKLFPYQKQDISLKKEHYHEIVF